VAQTWTEQEVSSAEPWYHLGLAESRQNNEAAALQHLNKALALNPQHADALYELGLIAAKQKDKSEMQRINIALNQLNDEMAEEFRKAAGCDKSCQ
jgi:tetratricopeptide (TPR) repeat protein